MSTYYDTWKSSEAARDQIYLTLVAWVTVQTVLYPALGRVIPGRYLSLARIAYVTLTVIADLAIGLALGAAIQ